MSQHPPNHRENTQGYVAGLPADRLNLPEPYLYKLLLEEQQVEDTAERRRQFKRLLVTRQMEEGIAPPQVDQKELRDFMNPDDPELQVERSQALVALLAKHLKETQDFVHAQRLAVTQLFHQEAPLRQVEMDETYFDNSELVRADLESLALEISKKLIKNVEAKDLNMNCLDASFALAAGEIVQGRTYLRRAAIALGMANSTEEASKVCKEILITLKQIAGLEVEEFPPIDEAYCNDSNRIRADLESLAKSVSNKVDKVILAKDLNTNHLKTFFTLSTGESMSGRRYSSYAAKALGKAKTDLEAQGMLTEMLTTLKQIAGFEVEVKDAIEYLPTDKAYFTDKTKVEADLRVLASITSEKYGRSIQPDRLKVHHIKNKLPFVCGTGESLGGHSYLVRAARVLGMAKDYKGAQKVFHEVLIFLKQTAGFESESAKVKKFPALTKSYFKDGEKVRSDLESLAAVASESTSDNVQLKDLTTFHRDITFTISTGDSMTGQTYLIYAAIALEKAKDNQEAKSMLKGILTQLKQTAGLEATSRDSIYFEDASNVRADLISFAGAVSKKAGKSIQASDLSTTYKHISFTLVTGESMTGRAYLNRAAKALGVSGEGFIAKSLIALKKIAGFEVVEFPPLDEVYFKDPEKVRADLESLARAASDKIGRPIKLVDIKTAYYAVSFALTSGKTVILDTYLSHTAMALGLAKKSREARKVRKETLRILKQIAGFTPE